MLSTTKTRVRQTTTLCIHFKIWSVSTEQTSEMPMAHDTHSIWLKSNIWKLLATAGSYSSDMYIADFCVRCHIIRQNHCLCSSSPMYDSYCCAAFAFILSIMCSIFATSEISSVHQRKKYKNSVEIKPQNIPVPKSFSTGHIRHMVLFSKSFAWANEKL